MIHKNEALLDEFRDAPRCGWCFGSIVGRADVHHLWAKGLGGGHRLDLRINLIPLCRFCHGEVHAGHIARHDLLLFVANREDTLQGHIETVILWLKRLPMGASEERIERGLAIMAPGPANLARRVIKEMNLVE